MNKLIKNDISKNDNNKLDFVRGQWGEVNGQRRTNDKKMNCEWVCEVVLRHFYDRKEVMMWAIRWVV